MFVRFSLLVRQPSRRIYSSIITNQSSPTGQGGSTAKINCNVPGLSNRVLNVPTGPVGPGAQTTGKYKVPEYYSFNRTSYHEAEIEMAQYRLPQPSAVKK